MFQMGHYENPIIEALFKTNSKAEAAAAPPNSPTANTAVSVEGVREALPPQAGLATVLQLSLPGSSPGVVPLEGSGAIPSYSRRPREAARAKPTLPRPRAEKEGTHICSG